MRAKIAACLVVLAAVLCFILGKSYLFPRSFTVVKIIDGDTIKLSDGRSIRYIGIDAPEKDSCYSQEASKFNSDLVLGKPVRLERDINEIDQFGRTLAYVYAQNETGEEIFVNQELLEQGAGEFFLDTVNLRYQAVLVQVADQAHENKQGLWGSCAPDPGSGCQIKGNLDRLDQRWYHLPSFRHYEATEVNLKHGDRWFCTEEQAQSAGFKRARE